jgi:hypothetical protein
MRPNNGLGSARASRAGDGASPSRTFFGSAFLSEQKKHVSARRRNQHAGGACAPRR